MIKFSDGKFYVRDADTFEEYEWFDPSEVELTYTQEEKDYEFPISISGDCSASFTATITGGTFYDWMMGIADMYERHRKEVQESKNNMYKPKAINWSTLHG